MKCTLISDDIKNYDKLISNSITLEKAKKQLKKIDKNNNIELYYNVLSSKKGYLYKGMDDIYYWVYLTEAQKKSFLNDSCNFLKDFYREMFELNLFNKYKETYKLNILSSTNYGFFAHLYLYAGLGFDSVKDKIDTIQQDLMCIWIMDVKQFKKYASVKIVTKPLDEKTPYKNPEIKPYQMYLGVDFSFKPIILDVNKVHHYLIAGATGAGKTRLQYMILLSWILNCAVNEVEIYLADLAKDSFRAFNWVKHVRYYATETEELRDMLKYIYKKMTKRTKMMGDLRDKGVATNIYEYNEYCKKQNKSGWSYVYILSDEFSVFTPDNTDSKEEKAMKSECLDMVKRLSKTGREMGIFVLNGVQKTTKEEIPSIIKSQSAVRVSFRANDAISSQVIMGDNSAVGLADRYAVYSLNGGEKKDYLFSPLLTTEMINRMLEPHIDRKHKKVDLSINDDVVQCDIKNTKMYPTNFSPEKINKTTIETFNSADYEEVI
jgi:hypothetical protein